MKVKILIACLFYTAVQVSEPVNQTCPDNMIYIEGQMINADSDYVEYLQNATCTEWIDKQYPARCKIFNKDHWLQVSKNLPRKKLNFCIDIYEYPNVKLSKPQVSVTWLDAQYICQEMGKRLCTEEEWTFACEGEEGLPYPYGYVRNSEVCNIDKPWIEVNYQKLNSKASYSSEIDRLWQGVNSGEMANCVSPFGVHDMTGNVDEWTSSKSTGYPSILKGGYWSTVRNRCRASTRSHNQWHKFYQQGFRCCQSISN